MEWTREPVLSDLLGDPITQALMVADRVEQNDFDILIGTVRCERRRYSAAKPNDEVSRGEIGPHRRRGEPR
jgi:hypothetical protein